MVGKEGLVLFLWIIQYPIVEYIAEFREQHYLPMWVDTYIPFWPPSILIYVLYFPLAVLPFLLIKDINILRKGVKAFIYGLMMTVGFYLVYPIWMVRPVNELQSGDIFDKMVSYLWQIDNGPGRIPLSICAEKNKIIFKSLAGYSGEVYLST